MKTIQKRIGRSAALLVIAALCAAPFPALAQDAPALSAGPRTITGTYQTTNPVFAQIGAEVGVLLYDASGVVARDWDYDPPESSQVLASVEGDIVSGSYALQLPETPAGVALDFDSDPATPPAVQVFTTALFIEFLGDPYLNRGESAMEFSLVLEPLTYNVIGGAVLAWAAQEGALFPAGAGPDRAIFTADDPLMPLPAGWSAVSFDAEPFAVQRQETVDVPIVESFGQLYDYSALSYREAWEALFARTQQTYPFTAQKALDWPAIYAEITPLIAQVTRDLDFHLVIARFGSLIPDTHVGYTSLPVLQTYLMGGIGVSGLAVTDSGEVVITGVEQNTPAAQAGMRPGDVLESVQGTPALAFLDDTPLLLNSASTPQGRRYFQAATMLQGPVGSQIALSWRAGGSGPAQQRTFTRVVDVAGLFKAFGGDVLFGPPVSGELLTSGLGVLRVPSFVNQVSRANALFGAELQQLIDAGAWGIVLDLRGNSGGLIDLALAMAGRFFTDYTRVFDLYYADGSGAFAYRGFLEILPGQPYFSGPVAVLVDEMTGSSGDLFAYTMQQAGRAIIVGETATGGFTGEVADGLYRLPGDLTLQIPTGRVVDPATQAVLLEGTGVLPDVRVPRTRESLISSEDEVLRAAESALMELLTQ